MERNPLDVVVVAYNGLCTFEFGIAVELFGLPRPEIKEWYRMRVARVEDGPMNAMGGFQISTPHTLRILDTAGTIIIPGWSSLYETVPKALIRKVQRAYADGARLLSVCSGSFVLAEAGLLEGKRAATHWKYADIFRQRFPDVEMDADVLYVDEGNIITSAGSAAGIDMGLHLIKRDFGSAVANTVARRMVVPPHREGGQQQFINTPVAPDPNEHAIARVQDALRAKLKKEHTIESMARIAKMSKRTFSRRFQAATGNTPHRWLQNERVRMAQSLLETTSLLLDGIAERVGFADTQLLRLHFKRVVGTSPAAYRKTFAK